VTEGEHNVYRDGKVHVLARECDTCIFRPHARPVPGARVAELVRETRDDAGASVVCHSTLYRDEPGEHAICRGWFDRLGDRDPIIRLAVALDVIVEQPPPEKHPQEVTP
jgi:hypothetical protein